MKAQPGWYNQPDGSQRYWDGRSWTHVRMPSDPEPAPPGAHHTAETPAPPTPFYKNKAFIGVAAAGALVVAFSAMSGGGREPEAAPQVVAVVTATATVTVEVPAPTPDVTTPPASAEPADAPIEPTLDPDDWDEAEQPETFKMPKLVGKNLQLAQDKLQSLGSWVLDQEDASGLDRFQILDSNWKVCSQKPKAGKVVSVDTVVVLKSVKLDEKCP